ncbi:MAG: ChaN family lipoprotein [Burkholderiaceae bacterium]|nr:ChaN family lipoprotein [Burkholderiaceae bacterium]
MQDDRGWRETIVDLFARSEPAAPGRRPRWQRLSSTIAAIALAACSALPGSPGGAALPPAAFDADLLLIGEVHDNAMQHRMRLRWLEQLAQRRRVVIALEQLDAVNQGALDRARAADRAAAARGDPLAQRARRIAEAAGFDFGGWHWEYYRPVIELALRRDLPLVAANLSRAETSDVARGRAPAAGEPAGWSAGDERTLEDSIRRGHCGLLPESLIGPMASAQRSRDARLARAVVDAHRASGLPVVLLAGNGHVRRDIGVPRYLAELAPHARVFGIGLLEAGEAASVPFDAAEVTAAAKREDPCNALRTKPLRTQSSQ